MTKLPAAAPRTEGRIFGTDWSIANVAKLMRSNAGRGTWRQDVAGGSSMARINQSYLRTVSARHLPTAVSLIFLQLEPASEASKSPTPNPQPRPSWYASLCFTDGETVLPWNREVAELWLNALFGEVPYVKMEPESSCAWVSASRSLPLQ